MRLYRIFKGLYTMNKWDLFLEYKDGSSYKKVTGVIHHTNRMKREKKAHVITSIITENNSAPFMIKS